MSREFDEHVWEAEQVRCVRCHADPGVPCTNTLTGQALHGVHWQRVRDIDRGSPPRIRAVPDRRQPSDE